MQLEEARRLAALQKRRELKAAGIEMPSRQRKARGIDYNTEVPFQKVAPAGFYDTVGEDAMAEAAIQSDDKFKSVLKSKLDAPRRDEAEKKARKQDAEKAKRKREDNLPDAVAQLNRLNDPLAIAKRGKLMLPPPQARAPHAARHASPLYLGPRPPARGALPSAHRTPPLTPFPPPFPGDRPRARECGQGERVDALRRRRLRRHASAAEFVRADAVGIVDAHAARRGREDTILEEAAAQAALMSGSTPLLGGESAAPLSKLGDFGGITPGARQAPTPNSALAGLTPGPGAGATPPAARRRRRRRRAASRRGARRWAARRRARRSRHQRGGRRRRPRRAAARGAAPCAKERRAALAAQRAAARTVQRVLDRDARAARRRRRG